MITTDDYTMSIAVPGVYSVTHDIGGSNYAPYHLRKLNETLTDIDKTKQVKIAFHIPIIFRKQEYAVYANVTLFAENPHVWFTSEPSPLPSVSKALNGDEHLKTTLIAAARTHLPELKRLARAEHLRRVREQMYRVRDNAVEFLKGLPNE